MSEGSAVAAARGDVRRRRSIPCALVIGVALSLACGSPVAPSEAPSTTSASTDRTSPGTDRSPSAAGQRFEVQAGESRATVRIREQLVMWTAADDAILTLDGLEGSFAIRSDGTFDSASLMTAALTGLRSDDFRRANAARETMNANRFPLVEFRPLRTIDLPLPLAASGTWRFRLVGSLKVNGVTRELEWESTAERKDERLMATALTSFKFGDFAMDVPRRGPVLSIVDEIRLQVDLVARSIDAVTCTATPQDVPANYVPDAPVRSRIGAGAYVFSGVVRSTRGCALLPGARIEVWLANPEGRYDADHRATLIADAQGRYRLETDPPAVYGGGRAHIHIRVTAQGHRPLVAIFFPAPGSSTGVMDLVMEPT